jgi:hypothetical protein
LPVNAKSINNAILPMVMLRAGVAWYNGLAHNSYNGTNGFINLVASSGSAGIPITSVQPFTWGTNDKIVINGSYESV